MILLWVQKKPSSCPPAGEAPDPPEAPSAQGSRGAPKAEVEGAFIKPTWACPFVVCICKCACEYTLNVYQYKFSHAYL